MNPYAPPTVNCDDTLPPAIREGLHLRTKWLRLVIVIYAVVTLAGVAIAAYEIESIMGSGPLLLLLGSALVVLAFRNRDLYSLLLGFSAFALSALVVALINLVPYSPSTGYWPLLTVLGVYALVSLPYAGWLIAVRQTTRLHDGG